MTLCIFFHCSTPEYLALWQVSILEWGGGGGETSEQSRQGTTYFSQREAAWSSAGRLWMVTFKLAAGVAYGADRRMPPSFL